MKENNKKFIYIVMYNLEENLNNLMDLHKWRTVPIVIERDNITMEEILIGGCDDAIKRFKCDGH